MAAIDKTPGESALESPAEITFDITPSDTAELLYVTRAIRAENAGTIIYLSRRGEQCTARFKAGETRPIRARQVLLTGTTGGMSLEGMA